MPPVSRSIRRAVNAVAFVLAAGTCGYMWIEGWGLEKALVFTIITLSTVGYGDYGLSAAGLRFSAVLLVAGVGVMTYSFGQLVPVLFNERAMLERTMKSKIRKLSDHFIVCGLGRVGRACCQCLAQRDIAFVCVESKAESVEWAIEHGYLVLHGDATHDDVLAEAGIQWARGLACLTDSDTENIVITLGARQLNPDLTIIARAEADGASQKMKRAGASRVISPSHAGGESIANTMVNPLVADLFETADASGHGLEFSELVIDDRSPLAGKTVGECRDAYANIVFVAVLQANEGMRISPGRDLELASGDVLVTAGDVVALGRMRDAAARLRSAA